MDLQHRLIAGRLTTTGLASAASSTAAGSDHIDLSLEVNQVSTLRRCAAPEGPNMSACAGSTCKRLAATIGRFDERVNEKHDRNGNQQPEQQDLQPSASKST